MMLQLLSAFLVSLGATAVVGLILIPLLRRLKAGQMIREDGPVWHRSKQGTPTMGGIMFIVGIAASCVIVGWGEMQNGEFGHIYILIFALIFAFIGFLDDFAKLTKKRNLGLTALQKFLLQLAAAVVLVLLMRLTNHLTPNLYIPFLNVYLMVSEPVYFVFAAFVIVAMVNAVNITDGIDGLLSGVTIPVAVCFAAVAFIWSYAYLGVIAAALCGGLAGFLLFNFHPARVFMGDTGSLFLGGIVCAMAFAMDVPLILIPVGIVYIIEVLSDVIQILYFKATKGKRVFKMAPLHHHLELSGWSEYRLFAVFVLVSALFSVIAFLSVSGRYALP